MTKGFKERRLDDNRMYDAIENGDLVAVRAIVKERPEIVDSYTFLAGGGLQHYAARFGQLDTLKLLFELGFTRDFPNGRDHDLPICSAAREGHADVVAYLISLGQPLEVTPSVCNPLLAAISGGRSADCVRLLLEAGIDAGHRYKGGPRGEMTAAAHALVHGLPGIADMIAEHLSDGDPAETENILKDAQQIAGLQGPLKPTRILPTQEDLAGS